MRRDGSYIISVPEIDLSGENIDLTSISQLGGLLASSKTYSPLEKFSLEGKTFKNKVYGTSSTSSSYQFYYLISPYSSNVAYGYLKEINLDRLIVDTNIDYFGYIGPSSTGYYIAAENAKFIATNMKLNNMKYPHFYTLDNYVELDISGTSAPKATSLVFSGWTSSNSTDNSNYNTTSPTYKSSMNRLKSIKLKGLDMPNLNSLAFRYLYNLTNIEMDLTTTNMTSFADCFRWCVSLKPETMPLS